MRIEGLVQGKVWSGLKSSYHMTSTTNPTF
jgi:hypothetical protein